MGDLRVQWLADHQPNPICGTVTCPDCGLQIDAANLVWAEPGAGEPDIWTLCARATPGHRLEGPILDGHEFVVLRLRCRPPAAHPCETNR
jgi:hypothetical protein